MAGDPQETKRCRRCLEEKSFDGFGVHYRQAEKAFHYPECNACRRLVANGRRCGEPLPTLGAPNPWTIDAAGNRVAKRCSQCEQVKPVCEFHRATRHGKPSYQPKCKECLQARDKQARSLKIATEPRHRYHPRFDESLGLMVKRCPRCHDEKVFEQEFGWQNKSKGKRFPLCRPCKRANEREWRTVNPDKQYAYKHKGRRAYAPEEAVRTCRKCRIEQPLEQFPWRCQYRSHTCSQCYLPRKGAEALRFWARHRDRYLQAMRDWRKANRDLARQRAYEYKAKRRARQAGVSTVERINRAEIIARDNRTCYLCGRTLAIGERVTLDHVQPLALGGSHTADNLRVACTSCNSRKNILTVEEFHRRRRLLAG